MRRLMFLSSVRGGRACFCGLREAVVFLALALGASGALALSPDVATVLGKAGDAFPARLEAVRSLGKSLSGEEIKELYGLLGRKPFEDPAKPEELNAIKNDVVNCLKSQAVFPSGLPERLIAMFHDRSHDETWRDYCVQHLGDVYPAIDGEDARKLAGGVLWEAAEMKEGSIPGTALIALFNLSGREGFEKERIAARALEMVRNASYGEPAKITALQIGAKLGERSMLPLARTLAAAGPVPVRMSAMACLGILGDGSDLTILKTAAAGGDIRLATAAHEAIRKLESRK